MAAQILEAAADRFAVGPPVFDDAVAGGAEVNLAARFDTKQFAHRFRYRDLPLDRNGGCHSGLLYSAGVSPLFEQAPYSNKRLTMDMLGNSLSCAIRWLSWRRSQ